jgi:type II secretory pathway component PulF
LPVEYVAFNNTGERVTGTLDLNSEEEAERILWAQGLTVVDVQRRVERRSEGPLTLVLRLLSGARRKDTIAFTRQLETLLRAGVALPSAMRQLRQDGRGISMRYALGRILEHVEGGGRFSTAVAEHPKVFPPYYIRMMPLAEETGELPRILRDLTGTMERQEKVGSQARNAILAPAFSLVVGFAAAFVLFTFVLPRLVTLLEEFGTELPLATRMLVNLAGFARDWGVTTVLIIVAVVLVLTLYMARTRRGRRLWDQILLRSPVAGPIIRSTSMFDVASMMSLLISSGISPVVALRTSVQTASNIHIREALERVDEAVTQGGRLGQALQEEPVIPRLYSDTVHNGEAAGALVHNLEALADYYQEETERRVQVGTTLIEPVAFLVVGAIIGFIAVAVIAGIYSIIPQVSAGI